MHLSTHTAQALNNAPLSDTRLPHWSWANLSVTTPVPATDMSAVAEAAPATVVTTAPSFLRRLLRRLADRSRPPTPEGSLLPVGWGDVATPIRAIIDRHSLSPSSFTRSPIGSSYDSLSLSGGLRAYHVASLKSLRGLGPASTPVARHPRRVSSQHPDLATYLLVQAYHSTFGLSFVTTLAAVHLG